MKWHGGKSELLQFIKFGLVGVSNTVISLAIYYIFVFIDPKYYMAGNVVGWIVSVANSYFLNHKFVFKDRTEGLRDTLKKIGKAYLSYGGTFLLSSALLLLEVEVFDWSEKICPIINLLITIPLNYLLNKLWVFQGKGR